MVKVISYDDIIVSFNRQEALQVAYIADAFMDESILDGGEELHAPFASGKQLTLLKQAVVKKIANDPVSFVPKFECVRFGSIILRPPPFIKLVWKSYLTSFFELLTNEELLDLLDIADTMAAWDLRKGVSYTIIYRIVVCGESFDEFFRDGKARLCESVKIYYIHGLKNAEDNDYCDPQDSSLLL